MGYYKNLEIALQVEEPDRVPGPRPASTHLAYNYGLTRKTVLEFEKTVKAARRTRDVKRFVFLLGLLLAAAFGIGGLLV